MSGVGERGGKKSPSRHLRARESQKNEEKKRKLQVHPLIGGEKRKSRFSASSKVGGETSKQK